MKEKLEESMAHWEKEIQYATEQHDFYKDKWISLMVDEVAADKKKKEEETKPPTDPIPKTDFEFVQNPLYVWAWDRKEVRTYLPLIQQLLQDRDKEFLSEIRQGILDCPKTDWGDTNEETPDSWEEGYEQCLEDTLDFINKLLETKLTMYQYGGGAISKDIKRHKDVKEESLL